MIGGKSYFGKTNRVGGGRKQVPRLRDWTRFANPITSLGMTIGACRSPSKSRSHDACSRDAHLSQKDAKDGAAAVVVAEGKPGFLASLGMTTFIFAITTFVFGMTAFIFQLLFPE
jgi:hypothetical protein